MILAHNSVFRSAMALCVVFVGLPAITATAGSADPSAAEADLVPAADDARARLIQHLVDRGAAEEEATLVVNTLTDEDVRVLADNPRMLTPAETNSTLITWAIFLAIIALGITLVVAASN